MPRTVSLTGDGLTQCRLGAEYDTGHDQGETSDGEECEKEEERVHSRRAKNLAGSVLCDEQLDPLSDLFPCESRVVRVYPLAQAAVRGGEADHRTEEWVVRGRAGTWDGVYHRSFGVIPGAPDSDAAGQETCCDADSK